MIRGTLWTVLFVVIVQSVLALNLRTRGLEELQKAWESEVQAGESDNSQETKGLRVTTAEYGNAYRLSQYRRGNLIFSDGTVDTDPEDEDTPAVPTDPGTEPRKNKKTNPLRKGGVASADITPHEQTQGQVQGLAEFTDNTSPDNGHPYTVVAADGSDNHWGVGQAAPTSHHQTQGQVEELTDDTVHHQSSADSHSSTELHHDNGHDNENNKKDSSKDKENDHKKHGHDDDDDDDDEKDKHKKGKKKKEDDDDDDDKEDKHKKHKKKKEDDDDDDDDKKSKKKKKKPDEGADKKKPDENGDKKVKRRPPTRLAVHRKPVGKKSPAKTED